MIHQRVNKREAGAEREVADQTGARLNEEFESRHVEQPVPASIRSHGEPEMTSAPSYSRFRGRYSGRRFCVVLGGGGARSLSSGVVESWLRIQPGGAGRSLHLLVYLFSLVL